MIIRNLRVPFNYAKFSSLKTIGLMLFQKIFFKYKKGEKF